MFISKHVIIHYLPQISSTRQLSQTLVHVVVVMINVTIKQAGAQPPRPLRNVHNVCKEVGRQKVLEKALLNLVKRSNPQRKQRLN